MIATKQLKPGTKVKIDRESNVWKRFSCLRIVKDRADTCYNCPMTDPNISIFTIQFTESSDVRFEEMNCDGTYRLDVLGAFSRLYVWRKL